MEAARVGPLEGKVAPLAEIEQQDRRRALDVALTGVWPCTTHEIRAVRRLAEPEEVAGGVSSRRSDRSSFATGHVMVADGGIPVNPHTT